MAIVRVAPNSDAGPNTWSGNSPRWDVVNDVVPDDAVGELSSFTNGDVEMFGLDVSLIDPIQRITAVEIEIRIDPGAAAGFWGVTPRFRVGGVDFDEAEILQLNGSGFLTTLINRDLNPGSGLRWTRDGLRNAQLGFEMTDAKGGMPGSGCTQCVLNVTTSAQSKLKAIKDYIIEQTSRISGIGSFGDKLKAWHEVVNYPAVYTIIGSEAKVPAPTRSKEGTAQFILPTVVKSENPLDAFMDLYEQIEESIEDDPSLDTLALEAHVSGFNALTTSATIAGQVHVADVFVDVIYRHARGDA